jgi:hypothetical protein
MLKFAGYEDFTLPCPEHGRVRQVKMQGRVTLPCGHLWCRDSFPAFIDKDHWPLNNPDLNLLDCSIWDQFVHAIP